MIKLCALCAVVSVGSATAEEGLPTFTELMDSSNKAYAVEDMHNGDLYNEMALMRHEGEGDPDYDWSAYKKLVGKLKDRKKEPFDCKAVEFFEATSNSDEKRICFVIDFSQSMKGKRIDLLRHELTDTINHLPAGTQASVLFFAGPTWIPGDEVKQDQNKLHYDVEHEGFTYQWSGKGAHDWSFETEPALPAWNEAGEDFKTQMAGLVKEQALVFGTDWEPPLSTALRMDPLPDVIYFMTDGSCSTADESSKVIAADALKKGVRIHSIAMMEPKAEKPMRFMARETGGDFVKITEDCECHVEKAGQHEASDDLDADRQKKRKVKRERKGKKERKRAKK